MFVKPFRVKSNTQLRNSERKRLKTRLLKEFPKLTDADIDVLIPQGDAIFLVKIITHGGEFAALYMVEKTPLMIEIDDVLFPSVYMLWRVPYVLPALTIWPQLYEKIIDGADLMLPGVVVKGPLHPKSYGSFKYGNRIIINTVDNKAPLAIGRAALSSFDMYMAAQRGKAVRIVHTVGDKLWEYGLKTEMPKLGPPDGYDDESGSSTSGTQTESIKSSCDNGSDSSEYYARYSGLQTESSENEESDEEESDGSLPPENVFNIHDETAGTDVAAESSVENLGGLKPVKTFFNIHDEAAGTGVSYAKSSVLELYDPDIHAETSTRGMTDRESLLVECDESLISDEIRSLKLVESSYDIREQTSQQSVTDEMDLMLEYCFVKGLKLALRKVDLPLLTSNFYKLYMIPACPLGQQLDLKKSVYKKLSRFLNEMEKRCIIKVKELIKGVDSIVYVDESHQMLREFVDMEPSKVPTASPGAARPLITEMYTITSIVLPVLSAFGFRKGDMVTIAELRKYVTEYVKKEKLQDPKDKSMVNINEELQKLVKDPYTIAVPWEDLMGLFVNHMTASYKMNINGQKSVAHKGKLEPIDIQIGRRTGNKKVTLVNNLELYGINIQEFARQCQHGVAASTSISTVPGKKSHQLLVQGNQVAFIGSLLTTKYNIPKRYIRGLENAPRPKK